MVGYLLIFIFGLCVGSFLNVIIYREVSGDEKLEMSGRLKVRSGKWLPSWMIGRSYCDHCKKKLYWFDNIPLLSFVLLNSKCRYCRKKISLQYPLVELITGLEFIWIYFLIKSNFDFFSRFEGFYSFLSLLIWLTLGACFLAIFVSDLKYQIIPDTAIFFGMVAVLFKIIIDYRYTGMINWSVFTSGIAAALFFLSLILITKGKGMGFGDVKLGFLMGLILGFPKILIALSFAFLTGAIAGVILIILKNKKLKSKIAFGPFLAAGTIFALIYGEKIWLYFN